MCCKELNKKVYKMEKLAEIKNFCCYYSIASHLHAMNRTLHAMNLTLCQLTKFMTTKLKALADVKLNIDHRMMFVFDWVKFMIGKGENGLQGFTIYRMAKF